MRQLIVNFTNSVGWPSCEICFFYNRKTDGGQDYLTWEIDGGQDCLVWDIGGGRDCFTFIVNVEIK